MPHQDIETKLKDGKEVPHLKLTDEERAVRQNYIKHLCEDRDERDSSHPELDDMTYIEYYDSNRKKDLSYIPPKKNKQDIRIVTGTTREKDTTLLSSLLNLNLEPDVSAFDEDDLFINELGTNMEDMVKKSREIEDYQLKRPIFYREMISQGDVFIRDIWVDKFKPVPTSELKWNPRKDDASKLDINERVKKVLSRAEHQMIPGKNIYLGDLREEYAQNQHRVSVLNVMSREEAKTIYGDWERWKYVPRQIDTLEPIFGDSGTYKTWSLVEHDYNEVAEVTIYDAANNRLQIFLNGIMMMPINYPLTAISPDSQVPIIQGKHEIISGFAYSKSQPSKTKVDQEVLDEATKLVVEKFRQGAKPPKGSKGKKIYGNEIFRAGRITADMGKDELFDLIQNPGVSPADFSFYQLFKESINEKTTNEVYSGDEGQGDMTATQAVQMKEQQLMKLGAAMDGVVNLERGLTYRRIYTICNKWTQVDKTSVVTKEEKKALKDVYKTISVSTTLENGEQGIKEFRFRDKAEEYPSEAEQEMEEEKLTEERGQPVRVVYLNPTRLRKMRATWYVQVNPTPKSQDKLSQIIFVQNVREAMEMFGPESLNIEYIKQRYAANIGEDYNKMFKQMDIMEMIEMQNLGQGQVVENAQKGMAADATQEEAAGKRPPQTRIPQSGMAKNVR